MAVVRQVVGQTLRGLRMRQRRTLREVSAQARVSLGYLSEIERGQKEASSELLAAICGALEVELSELFAQVSQGLQREERLAGLHRMALVGSAGGVLGTGKAHIVPAPAMPSASGGGEVRALVAAVEVPTAAA